MIPAHLEPVLAAAGLDAERCCLLRSVARPGGKLLLRLRGQDGQPLKVRQFPTPAAAMAMVRLRQLIGNHSGFSRVLASAGVHVLEEWVVGTSLGNTTTSPELARASGALLAELHRVPLPHGWPAVATLNPLVETTTARLRGLAEASALPPGTADQLVGELLSTAPQEARQGLLHFDFSGENLVLSRERGVVSIDNERLRLGPLAYDIGRTMARWPLDPEACAAFLDGYGKAAETPVWADQRFWTLTALVTSAWYRLRHDQERAHVPLLALQAWSSGGDTWK
jgi:aminoglycoside phosphotransferase (APT) family kinase protein